MMLKKLVLRGQRSRCKGGYSAICAASVCVMICVCLLCSCSVLESKTSRDFTMEGDILSSYNGESAIVNVPQNVCELSENAFRHAPNASQITTINLGVHVKTIDFAAFRGLSSLCAISVSPENPHYLTIDNFLLATDGSAIFYFGSSKLDIYPIINTLDDQVKNIPFYKDGYRVIFNDAVLSFAEDPALNKNAPTIEDGWLIEMNAKGHTVKFATPIQYYGDHIWSLFEADDVIVFSDLVDYSVGDTYVFTDECLYEQHNLSSASASNYNTPVVVFSPGEDGRLEYTCKPLKFITFGDGGMEFLYGVSMDEIYMENGTVLFENGKPQYTAESQTTFAQKYGKDNLEESYRLTRDAVLSQNSEVFNTLEEYLENNAKKYKAFDPSILRS